MKTPAYYKDGLPYDANGQVIITMTRNKPPIPLVTDLGDGRFQFKSQKKVCYLRYVNALGITWVMDRDDGGIAACFATEAEQLVAVNLITGQMPAPVYTQEQLAAAVAMLQSPWVLAWDRSRWSMLFAEAGYGAMVIAGETASALRAVIARTVALLTASSLGPGAAAASTLLFSPSVGVGSDRVPGRDLSTMFAFDARLLAGEGGKINPGPSSVNLPVRGSLVERDGQFMLELVKTGEWLSPTVPVLSAVRDPVTGLDRITLPGDPSGTLLINPVPSPAGPSDTGNQDRVPVTPVHTGTNVKPIQNIVVTPPPAGYQPGMSDFIYWRPDAKGTGVEPIYVVVSNPYGKTNAKGKYSGREYNADKAGGPVQELDWRTATINRAGVDEVKLHTGRFYPSAANEIMIEQLNKILNGELQVTDIDKRFYTHEIRELERYRNLGIKDGYLPANPEEIWNNTHTATLEDYKLTGNETLLYTREALKAAEEQELRMLK